MLGLKLIHVSKRGHWLPRWLRMPWYACLTHWGRVTHICVSKLTIIGSDNGLSPGRCQAIIWTNAGKLLIRPLGTNFNEMLIEILTFSFTKMRLKVSSAKWRPSLSRPQCVKTDHCCCDDLGRTNSKPSAVLVLAYFQSEPSLQKLQ